MSDRVKVSLLRLQLLRPVTAGDATLARWNQRATKRVGFDASGMGGAWQAHERFAVEGFKSATLSPVVASLETAVVVVDGLTFI